MWGCLAFCLPVLNTGYTFAASYSCCIWDIPSAAAYSCCTRHLPLLLPTRFAYGIVTCSVTCQPLATMPPIPANSCLIALCYSGTQFVRTRLSTYTQLSRTLCQLWTSPIAKHLFIFSILREHLVSSHFFSKRNAFQIGFTPLPPPSIRKAYRTFSDNNRCRPSSRPRLSRTKLLRASLLSFSSREASAVNIISTSSSFPPFPDSLHESSALRLASTRGRPGLQQRKHL